MPLCSIVLLSRFLSDAFDRSTRGAFSGLEVQLEPDFDRCKFSCEVLWACSDQEVLYNVLTTK